MNIPLNVLQREKLYISLVEDAIYDSTEKSNSAGIILGSTSISLRKLFPRKNKWVDLKLSMEGPDGTVKEGVFVSLTASLTVDDNVVLPVNAGMSSPNSSESDVSPTVVTERYSPVGFVNSSSDLLKTIVNRSVGSDGVVQESEKGGVVSPVNSATKRISSASPLQIFSIPEETSVDVPSPKEQPLQDVSQTSATESIISILASRTKRPGNYSCGLRSEAHSNRQQQNIEKQLKRERTALRNSELQTQVAKLQSEMELLTSTLLSTMETVEILKQTRSDVAKEIVEWNETFNTLCGFQPDFNDKKKSAVFKALGQAYLDTQHALKVAYDDALKILSLAKPKNDELQKAQNELQGTLTYFYQQKVPSMDIKLNITDPYGVDNSSLAEIIAESTDRGAEKSVTLLESLAHYTTNTGSSNSESSTTASNNLPFHATSTRSSATSSAKSYTGTAISETETHSARSAASEHFLSAMFMGNALDVMKRQTTPERRVSSAFIGSLIGNFSPPRTALASGIASNSSRPATPERRLSTMLIGDIFAIAAAPSTDKLKNLNSQRLLQQQHQQHAEQAQKTVTPPRHFSMLFVDNIMRSVTPPSVSGQVSEPTRTTSSTIVSDIMFNSIVRTATPPPVSVSVSTAKETAAPTMNRSTDSKSPLRARIGGKSSDNFSTDAMGNLVREKKQSPVPSTSSAKLRKSPYVSDTSAVVKKPVSAYKTDSMGNLIPSPQAKGTSSSPSQVVRKFDVMGNLIQTSTSSKSPQSNSRKGVSSSPSHSGRQFDVMGNLIVKPTAKNDTDALGNSNRSSKTLAKNKSSSTKLKEKEEKPLSSKKSQVQISSESSLSRSSSTASARQQALKALSLKSPSLSSSMDLNDQISAKVISSILPVLPSNQPSASPLRETSIPASIPMVEDMFEISPKLDYSPVNFPISSQEDSSKSVTTETVPSAMDINLSSIREEDGFGSLDGSSIVSTSDTESLASMSTGASSAVPKEKEYKQLKKDLRKWKAEFVASYGRDPVASDFPNIDNEIKEKISRKNLLSKEIQEARIKRSKFKH